ncbi:hypothetical protein BH18ACT9_BH18ACT9_16070 [soil metagenome]
MAVKIRLKRMGKIRAPYYRVVVVDSRKKRDGRVIEEIGKYHPKEEPSLIDVTSERAQYWLGVGAQPSEAVQALLKITGDWQTFKGLPGTEGTLRLKDPKRAKDEIFNEALKDAGSEPKAEAVTRKAAAKKSAKPAAEAAGSEPPAQAPAGESPQDAAASADAEGEAQPAAADAAESIEPAGTDAASPEPVEPAQPVEAAPTDADEPAEVAPATADKPAEAAPSTADKPAEAAPAAADKPAGA